MGAIANLASRSVVVAPGAQANTEIRVRNNGTVVDQFTIAVLGDATAWSAAEPPVVSLFPGAEQVVRVTFRPPRSPDVPADNGSTRAFPTPSDGERKAAAEKQKRCRLWDLRYGRPRYH